MKFNKIWLMSLTAALFTLSACSDDDSVTATALPEPAPAEEASTVNSLSFSWTRVANATQYGYQLVDADENIITTDVTREQEVTITGLKPATTYTLTVWAYGAVGSENGKSKIAEITATTAATEQLSAPSNLEMTYEGQGVTKLSWDRVSNAAGYSYTLTGAGETITGETDKSTCAVEFETLKHMEYTFEVKALTSKDEYTEGDASTVTFTVEAEEAWSIDGRMTISLIDEVYELTLTAYDDGVYCLAAWYGVDGYDLWFRLGTGGAVIPWGDYTDNNGVYAIPTGEESPASVNLYTATNLASKFSGNKDNGGEISFNTTGYAGIVDQTFTWEATVVTELYHANGTATLDLTGGTYDATIYVYSNNTAVIKDWCGKAGNDLEFSFNASGTITGYSNGYPGYGSTQYQYECIASGISGDNYWLLCYYGQYEGDDNAYISGGVNGGEVWFYCDNYYEGYGEYTFEWSEGVKAINLAGDYTFVTSGQEYVSDYTNWYDFNYDGDYTVTRDEDGNYIFDNFYWWGYPVVGVFNQDDMTVTIQPSECGYYTLASDSGETDPMVGIVSDDGNVITFTGWNMWYSGWYYFWNTETVFTRR